MADIVERLINYRPESGWGDKVHHTICTEAAGEISSLQKRCEELEAALEPFSKFAGVVFERNFDNDDPIDTMTACDGKQVTLFGRDYFKARAAISIKEQG